MWSWRCVPSAGGPEQRLKSQPFPHTKRNDGVSGVVWVLCECCSADDPVFAVCTGGGPSLPWSWPAVALAVGLKADCGGRQQHHPFRPFRGGLLLKMLCGDARGGHVGSWCSRALPFLSLAEVGQPSLFYAQINRVCKCCCSLQLDFSWLGIVSFFLKHWIFTTLSHGVHARSLKLPIEWGLPAAQQHYNISSLWSRNSTGNSCILL